MIEGFVVATQSSFSRSLPLSLQGNLWLLFVSDTVARMHPVLEATIARNVTQIVIGPHRRLEPIALMGLPSRSNGVSLTLLPCHVPMCKFHTTVLAGDARFRELCVQIPSVRRVPSRSWVRLGQLRLPAANASSSKCRRSITSLSSTRRHMCVVVPHTGTRNSRNRFHMSSTGEEVSKYSADDPRSARAVSKLGVIRPELDSKASDNPSTPGATSLASALRAPSTVV